MEPQAKVVTRNELILGAASLAGLWILSFQDYLLFHSIAEFFSIAVACGIFLVAFNTRAFSRNGYLLFLGLAYAFVACVDLLHLLSYKGMGVFPGVSSNPATQLWIIARSVQAVSLAAAPLFLRRAFRPRLVFLVYFLVSAGLLALVYHGAFPVCFGPGGLTPFKKTAEYAISAVLVLSLVLLMRKKEEFSPIVLKTVAFSILLTIGSELSFTFYVSVYGLSNMVGHLFKIAAFYLIYKALVRTSLIDPYTMLFRDLQKSRQDLKRANDELEERVRDRTRELSLANVELLSRAEELAESRSALAGERQRLYSVLESLPVFVYLRGADFRIAFANRMFRERFGEPGEAPCHRILWGREEPCPDCPMNRVMETGKPWRMQWNPAPDGRVYDLYDYPFTDTDGSRLVLEMGVDVTERERARNALVLHARKLEDANENIRDFAFVAAHDLQEPLRKVHTLSDQLRLRLSGKLSDGDESRLDRLMRSAARMRTMVAALLRFHQVAALEEPEETVELSGVLSGVLEELAPLVRAMGARVDVGPLPSVRARPRLMRELFASLVSNALYFKGDGPPEITVDSRPVPGPEPPEPGVAWHEVRVADKGAGFDMRYADKIFKPFQRLGVGDRNDRAGMGLAVARRVVDMMGGRISVQSEPGKGTVFTVLMPGRNRQPVGEPWETRVNPSS